MKPLLEKIIPDFINSFKQEGVDRFFLVINESVEVLHKEGDLQLIFSKVDSLSEIKLKLKKLQPDLDKHVQHFKHEKVWNLNTFGYKLDNGSIILIKISIYPIEVLTNNEDHYLLIIQGDREIPSSLVFADSKNKLTEIKNKVLHLEAQLVSFKEDLSNFTENLLKENQEEIMNSNDEQAEDEMIEDLENYIKELKEADDHTSLAVIEWDLDFKIKNWSSKAEELFGWKFHEVKNKRKQDFTFVFEDDIQEITELEIKLSKGLEKHSKVASRNYTNVGTLNYCEWYYSAIHSKEGKILSYISKVNNVTLLKLSKDAEEQGRDLERKRLAREVQNGLGKILTSTKFKVSNLIQVEPERIPDKVMEVEAMLDEAIEEVRRISLDFFPQSLLQFGLLSAINELCEQIRANTGIKINFYNIGAKINIDNKTLTTLYRITQEALNNVVKHSMASEVKIHLFQSEKSLELKIKDNGRGFDPKMGFSNGGGIRNMEERTQYIHGRFQLSSEIEKGTMIIIFVPLEYNLNVFTKDGKNKGLNR